MTRTARCGTGSRSPSASSYFSARSLRRTTGPYAVQAAIADLHRHQPRAWQQIAVLYDALARQTRSGSWN